MKTLAGYSDKFSAAPGETISFYVNSEDGLPYQAKLVRLIHGDDFPGGPGYKDEPHAAPFEGRHEGRHQPIHAGSYAYVAAPDRFDDLASFTLQLILWPTTPGRGEQALLAHWDGSRGFQLLLDAQGAATIRVGDGESVASCSAGQPLDWRRWYLISASYDAATGELRVHQLLLEDEGTSHGAQAAGSFRPALNAPLTIAALKTPDGPPSRHYNGKLEAPRIFSGVLAAAELSAPIAAETARRRADFLAGWDFARDMTSEILRDITDPAMDAHTVHMPTRAMTGHNWNGEEMSWRNRPEHYGAVHFHDDDVYDAGWDVSFDWRVPDDMKSGVYCAHLSNENGEEFIPFVVRPPAGKPSSKLVFLMPTASYMAYANEHVSTDASLAELLITKLSVFRAHDMFLATHREYGNSLYDHHADGTGVSYSSRLRPMLNMRPKVEDGPGSIGSSVWQLAADTHITAFLEQSGFDFDVITDEDLHRDGLAALDGYHCIVTGSHPEYHSKEMLDAIEGFTGRGGRLLYMGGNGFYWRIAYHPTAPGILELRRAEDGIRTWLSAPGEYYHAFTGEYGGLWQRNGRPPQSVVGIGTTAQGFDTSSYYRRTEHSQGQRAGFIFRDIDDEIIGDFGVVGGGAAGSEIDRADTSLGTPRHALVVASSEKHTDAYLMVPEDIYATTLNMGGAQNPLVRADMVFFETPSGGAVFSTGSIAWAGALSHNDYDNNVARLTGNVIERFLDDAPFKMPG